MLPRVAVGCIRLIWSRGFSRISRRVHSMHRSSAALHIRAMPVDGVSDESRRVHSIDLESRLQPDQACRIRLAVPAGIPPAEAGTPGQCISGLCRWIAVPMKAVGCIRLMWSRGFSRIRLARQDAAVPAGIPPAEAGTPGRSYPGYADG